MVYLDDLTIGFCASGGNFRESKRTFVNRL